MIVFKSAKEMPPMAISLADMSYNKTGSWRYLRPVYQEKLSPCKAACPAGNDIPRIMALVGEGRFVEAWKLFRETNPFPGVCGRVCYHPCETACNRKNFDETVSVAALERLVADECFDLDDEILISERRPERVAIVGSGPAGLACSYFLARAGYSVTVFEAESELGGMLRVGIPAYRLPRAVLDNEIERILSLGVEFKSRTRIGTDIDLEKLWQRYDALFVATGAHRSKSLDIPGENEPGVLSGLEFLKSVNAGNSVQLGQRVLVIGGGNTAIDAVRTARRLGTHPALVYRRTRAEMPAIPEEIEEAEHEGIAFIFLAAPESIKRIDHQLEVTFIRMKLGEPDVKGRRRPVPIPHSEFVLQADSVIKAVGEDPDLSFVEESLETSAGIVMSYPQSLLRCAGVFLGGDARTGPSTVVQAIASGKEVAHAIQRYLRNDRSTRASQKREEAKQLNLDYFTHESRALTTHLSAEKRVASFDEVKARLSPVMAIAEAKRCFSCGVCNYCENCRIFCPDVAIERTNNSYEVNLDFCKGCGICAQECPRGVISLAEERR